MTVDLIPVPAGVAPAPYAHVAAATGRLVSIAGQIALDEHGALVGPGDHTAQARQVFENLRRCLAAAGADFSHVIKLTWYVTDITAMGAYREVRAGHIPDDRLPTMSAIQVAALIRPDLLLEVDALAVVPA